jgi:hypothetical protein
MPVQQKEAGLACQTCLDALAIAIPIRGGEDELDMLTYDDIQVFRLTCKELREIANALVTNLWLHGANQDFGKF